MRITNNFDLPEPLYQAICGSIRDPEPGILHVTELISAPQIVALTRAHWNELVTDATDLVWAWLGSSVHKILEEVEVPNSIQENRLNYKLDDNWELSGQVDLLHDGVMTDYKMTSVWSLILGEKPEWDRQVNVYAFLFREAGYEVKEAQISALLRDWMMSEYKRMKDYPEKQAITKAVPLWSHDAVHDYIHGRFEVHRAALEGSPPPPCTDEERWRKDHIWKVKKVGNKRAIKGGNCKSEKEANVLLKTLKVIGKDKHEIEFIPGKPTRCLSYCSVSEFCHQWAAERNQYESESV